MTGTAEGTTTDGTPPDGRTLRDCLRHAARWFPDAEAVRYKDRSLSYGELQRMSSALAATLRDAGVRPGDRVGLWLNKSPEAVVAVHAVLQAGAAYVPVDPMAPPLRAAYILADCQVRALVTTREHLTLLAQDAPSGPLLAVLVDERPAPRSWPTGAAFGHVTCVSWDEAIAARPRTGLNPVSGPRPGDLAYVLYTSGSTGAPKGVMLSHRNGRVFADWATRLLALTEHDRIAGHAPLHFDLSVFDVFAAATAGATLVLVPENRQSMGAALNRLVLEERITVWYSVPSALMRMLAATDHTPLTEAALRAVLFAGEVFPVKHLRELHQAVPRAALYNLYGPTETNVCTYHQVTEADLAPTRSRPVSIGRACPYAGISVVDASGAVLPEAEAEGELCVSGASVMLGYWGDPVLTKERLLPGDGNGAGPLVHRTGDLVRRDADGDLTFLGRRDHMVKVRGYRVELGEVESALLRHPTVQEAVVLAVSAADGALRLEACVVPRPGAQPQEADLRRHCLQTVPRYMVPERLHVRTRLPLTSTGKVDRRALAATLGATP